MTTIRTKGRDQWHRPRETDWQRERRTGPLQPMEQRGWLGRLFG